MDVFSAVSLAALDADCDDSKRVLEVAKEFKRRFGSDPMGVARAPGRVNLIGEHIDYEGYAVLPMAIKQSVCVAFGISNISDGSQSGVTAVTFDNVSPYYRKVTLSMKMTQDEQMTDLGASWAKYALCGVLGIKDAYPEGFTGGSKELKLLVSGDVPAGCGLSSSSALLVSSALATSGALQPQQLPGKMALAEICRQTEHRVGTMGGGMDQAISCLAQRGVALHLDFASAPAKKSLVDLGCEGAGVTFVVANSMVVAEKAVDAATRYNKRVVECALAAKLIAMRSGIVDWRNITRLVDVHKALEDAKSGGVTFDNLQTLATRYCSEDEYSIAKLEDEFKEPVANLFKGSRLEAASKVVITSANDFKLQQRARHVWSEARRVEQFCKVCEVLTKETKSSSSQQELVKSLGEIMSASHESCRTLYECSCPELDSLVENAKAAGALGARLTGAGWGGCIVALVNKAEVTNFMNTIKSHYYKNDASNAMFESSPSSGAKMFVP